MAVLVVSYRFARDCEFYDKIFAIVEIRDPRKLQPQLHKLQATALSGHGVSWPRIMMTAMTPSPQLHRAQDRHGMLVYSISIGPRCADGVEDGSVYLMAQGAHGRIMHTMPVTATVSCIAPFFFHRIASVIAWMQCLIGASEEFGEGLWGISFMHGHGCLPGQPWG